MGMGMNPMGMGMMNPMGMMSMMPMAAMGMGMMPMAAMGMRMRMIGAAEAAESAGGDNQASSPEAGTAVQFAAVGSGVPQIGVASSGVGGGGGEADGVIAALETIDDGSCVQVSYTHPQLGKTTYRGVLAERYEGVSHVQSYIELRDSQRIGRRGHLREKESTKRLMCAFIDRLRRLSAGSMLLAGARGRSRSRSRGADHNG